MSGVCADVKDTSNKNQFSKNHKKLDGSYKSTKELDNLKSHHNKKSNSSNKTNQTHPKQHTTSTGTGTRLSSGTRTETTSSSSSSSRAACRYSGASIHKSIGNTTPALLRNEIPKREYDKLSPTPLSNHCGSARSSISSSGSNAAIENGTIGTTTKKSGCNQKKIGGKNTSNGNGNNDKDGDGLSSVGRIHTDAMDKHNHLNSKLNKKCPIHQTSSKVSKETITEDEHFFSGSSNGRSSDDTLILRISDLEKSTGERSSTMNGCKTAETVSKTKYRTRTEPNPLPLSPKQKQQRRSSSTLVHQSNQLQKCGDSPRIGDEGHNANSKCNCNSCYAYVSNMKSLSSTSSGAYHRTKSVGTQHDANVAFDPWIKQTDAVSNASMNQRRQSGSSNAKVIVITDDFKKKALNQEVLVDTKRKILKYMKTNKSLGSSRSMDDVCIDNGNITTVGDTNTNRKIVKTKTATAATATSDVDNAQSDSNDKANAKAISKSVDNISLMSNENDVLDNVGSVELIFISDEFLNKANSQQDDVIVLKNNGVAKASVKNGNSNPANDTEIIVVSDDFRRKSLQDQKIVIINEPKKSKGRANPKLSRHSSGESSIDDVNNKITTRAFQSYDEEAENLESKDLKTAVVEETEILL